MKIEDKKLLKYVGIAALVVCFFAVGFVFGRVGKVSSVVSSFNRKNFDTFWEVWDTLKSQYVDESKVDEKEMYYGSIKGMVNSLNDPATTYLDPDETEQFNKNIEGKTFQGIGAELSYENGQIVVVAPIVGSPAQKAGVLAGDIILQINNEDIKASESIYDVVAKIRGESGTTVKITVLHKGDTKVTKIDIVRGEIDVPSMEVREVAGNSSLKTLKITRFTDETVAAWNSNWDKSINEIVDSKAKGLIIDLRGNPGGYFDSAIYAGNEFLPKGTILAKQEDKAGKQDVFRVTRSGKLQNIPIVVLVDDGSASASEILAGLLQKNNRSVIVGEKTYGKGTAQSIVDLDDGSSLHITILKWLLPDGTWLNRENPITPDTVVEFSDVEFKKGRDTQLLKAVEILKTKIN